MSFEGIPIIGQTRTWKNLRFIAQPLAQQPDVVLPGTQPVIRGWQVGLIGLRSDDFPCQMAMIIDVTKVGKDPLASMFQMFGMLVSNLETFRTCNCLPGQPCQMHTPNVAQGRPS